MKMTGDENWDWDEKVQELTEEGYPKICPNDLPVRCIMYDGTMMEHDAARHPDYKFPVGADYIGKEDIGLMTDSEGKSYSDAHLAEVLSYEEHALLYCDGYIAVTIYECCYAMWNVADGSVQGGSLWDKGNWKLTDESLEKIRERFSCKHRNFHTKATDDADAALTSCEE
jgi:hypothetical protein